jgi:hypothetical protein
VNGTKYTLDDIKAMSEGEWRIVVLNRFDKHDGLCDRVRWLEKIAYTAIGISVITGGILGWALKAFVDHISIHPLP